MRFWRQPFRVVIGLTVVALLPVPLLLAVILTPPNPACFEYCSLGQQFAGMLLLLDGVLWLAVVLVFAWDWVGQEPTVAAISAVVASALMLIVTLRLFKVVPIGAIPDPLLLLAWVLALGMQLPPVWRLADRRSPSIPLQIVVGLMGLIVAVAGIAAVLLGSSGTLSPGSSFVVIAWLASVVGVLIVALAAWRDGVAEPRLRDPARHREPADPAAAHRDRGARRHRVRDLRGASTVGNRVAVDRVGLVSWRRRTADAGGFLAQGVGPGHRRPRRILGDLADRAGPVSAARIASTR